MKALTRKPVTVALAAALFAVAGTADAADWIVRFGGHTIDPKSNNHELVNVGSGQSLTFNATYLLSDNWGVEVLAALPFSHDITLKADGSRVAETKQLPPTVSLQYHFMPDRRVSPYLGAGLNATVFFDEKTAGALAGSKLSLDDSFGVAAQAGVDFALSPQWLINVDARWIDIDTNARLDGASLGTVAIDPYAFGVSVGYRFGKQ